MKSLGHVNGDEEDCDNAEFDVLLIYFSLRRRSFLHFEASSAGSLLLLREKEITERDSRVYGN